MGSREKKGLTKKVRGVRAARRGNMWGALVENKPFKKLGGGAGRTRPLKQSWVAGAFKKGKARKLSLNLTIADLTNKNAGAARSKKGKYEAGFGRKQTFKKTGRRRQHN